MLCLTRKPEKETSGEKEGSPEFFFSGDVPQGLLSKSNLVRAFGFYKTTENTSLRKLCEKLPFLRRALKNHIKRFINGSDSPPTREEIKNRYKCDDPDFFNEIIDLLIHNHELEERDDRLYPPKEINRKLIAEELLPKLLASQDKGAWKVLNQLDKRQEWKVKGREIIKEMEEKGSLVNIGGELLPFFHIDEILNIEYVDGKIKWSIQEDARWEYWRNICEEIEISIGEFESSRGSGFGEIDSSEINPGRHNLRASFTYIVREEEEEVFTRKKAKLTEKGIIVPPKFKIYSSLKIDEQILEIDAHPKVLEQINLEMLGLSDDTPIVPSNVNWVQKGGDSYARIGKKTNFSLRVDGKDLSNWIEECSLRDFFENFLEISIRGADAPNQNCECEIEADSLILDLFDKDLSRMLDLYVNGEKVGIEEESEDYCFSAWKAKQHEYRVQIKIDYEKGSLALKEKILRVPFPKPKIEIMGV